MRCAEMVRGASLRGPKDALGFDAALRLGRALGTLARRRARNAPILLGRTSGVAETRVRDGLAAGLVLAGVTVVDIGVVESDRFTGALRAGPKPWWPLAGGVYVSIAGDSVGVMVFDGMRPVVGAPLADVARIADDAFALAEGGIVVALDARVLPRAPVQDTLANDGAP